MARRWVKNGKLSATRAQVNGRLYFDTAVVLRALGWNGED